MTSAPTQVAAVCALAVDMAATTQQMRAWWRDHKKQMAALTDDERAELTQRAQRRAREMGE